MRSKLILTVVSALITLLISVPLAGAGERITADNTGQISRLARFGQGIVNRAVFSPDGGVVAVATSLGIRFYDFNTLAEVSLIETSSSVQHIAFSPDGSSVAAGLRNGTVCVYHVPWGGNLFTLEGNGGSITGVSFSPDGTILASGSADGTVRLWRFSDGESLGIINMPYSTPVYGIAFSPDGLALASAADQIVSLWSIPDGEEIKTIECEGTIIDLTFSPDGSTLACASWDHICLLGVQDGAIQRVIECFNMGSVAFSPDGSILAGGTYEKAVHLWRVTDGSLIATLEDSTGPVKNVNFSPDGSSLAAAADRTVHLWRVPVSVTSTPLAPLLTLKGNFYKVACAVFSPDGSTLASSSHTDNIVRLWDTSDGNFRRTLVGHRGPVECAAFSTDGSILATGSQDKTIRLWAGAEGKFKRALACTAQPSCIVFSQDSSLIAAGSFDNTVGLWRVSDGKCLLRLAGHTELVLCVSLSLDGSVLASGSQDNTVRVWRTSDGSLIQVLEGVKGFVNSVALSPDGSILAAASGDGKVHLWRISDGLLLHTLSCNTSVKSMVFGPDGSTLFAYDDWGPVSQWEVAAGILLQKYDRRGNGNPKGIGLNSDYGVTLAYVSYPDDGKLNLRMISGKGHVISRVIRFEGNSSTSSALAFSQDSSMLATVSEDNIYLWRISDGALLKTLTEVNDGACVAFSPDGTKLAFGSGTSAAVGGILDVWTVPEGRLLYSVPDRGVDSVIFSPDGSLLATYSPRKESVTLWKAADGTRLHSLGDGCQGCYGPKIFAFTPDGTGLAVATYDNMLRLWRVSDGSLLHTYDLPAMPFDLYLLEGSVLSLCLEYPEDEGQTVTSHCFSGGLGWLEGCPVDLNCLDFSPDGSILATGHRDGTIRLWRSCDGILLQTITNRDTAFLKPTFSQDGAILASTSDDGTVCLWGITSQQATEITE